MYMYRCLVLGCVMCCCSSLFGETIMKIVYNQDFPLLNEIKHRCPSLFAVDMAA
jgi:hypothetical protein